LDELLLPEKSGSACKVVRGKVARLHGRRCCVEGKLQKAVEAVMVAGGRLARGMVLLVVRVRGREREREETAGRMRGEEGEGREKERKTKEEM
jgi:hypothetical protein